MKMSKCDALPQGQEDPGSVVLIDGAEVVDKTQIVYADLRSLDTRQIIVLSY